MIGFFALLLFPVAVWAQEAPLPGGVFPGAGQEMERGPGGGRGPMGVGPGGMGAFWKNPEIVKQINLTEAQIDTIKAAFQDHRRKLIDMRAALEKTEAALQDELDLDTLDAAKAASKADAVIAARSQLQKEFVQMMLKVRTTLSHEQWDKLNTLSPRHGPESRGMKGPAVPPQD